MVMAEPNSKVEFGKNPDPFIVTVDPTAPEFGESEVIVGVLVWVACAVLLTVTVHVHLPTLFESVQTDM